MTTFTILLIDKNDNAPKFNSSEYRLQITELAQVGFALPLFIQAEDKDEVCIALSDASKILRKISIVTRNVISEDWPQPRHLLCNITDKLDINPTSLPFLHCILLVFISVLQFYSTGLWKTSEVKFLLTARSYNIPYWIITWSPEIGKLSHWTQICLQIYDNYWYYSNYNYFINIIINRD